MRRFVFLSRKKFEAMLENELEKREALAVKEYEYELMMKQANIAMLQSQINPHFLYNTLECIRGQALLNNEKAIADTAKALALFFRYSISGNESVVALSDELDVLKSYIFIQEYRFSGRFSINYDIGNCDPLVIKIPKMTLQPIIENAVIHGFADKTEGGLITLSCRIVDSTACISIKDNGIGMDAPTLQKLRNKIREGKQMNTGSTGIGLANVERRLKLIFGENYGLDVESIIGLGTTVMVTVPAGDK